MSKWMKRTLCLLLASLLLCSVAAIAEPAEVHLHPPLDMFVPFEGLDAIVIKLGFFGVLFLCHGFK